LFLLPKKYHNDDNYIISLGELCSWLGRQAEGLGVDIITGYSGDQLVLDD
jgi:electron-transferring-flavoprotein dehydrogenase